MLNADAKSFAIVTNTSTWSRDNFPNIFRPLCHLCPPSARSVHASFRYLRSYVTPPDRMEHTLQSLFGIVRPQLVSLHSIDMPNSIHCGSISRNTAMASTYSVA